MGDSVDRLIFEADTSSKKRSGVHRPIFAPFFTQPAIDVSIPSKVHLLVNPYSGRKKGLLVGQEAERLLIEAGVVVDVHHSEYASHLVEIAASLDLSDGDCIAVVGGDGSLSEAITGWMRTKPTTTPIFAVIPAGTGNSQGTELGISGVDDGVSRILRGRTQAIDLAEVNLRSGNRKDPGPEMTWYSHNLVTWGLGVDSVVLAEKLRWMGPIRYDVGIVMMMLVNRRRRATLTLDGHRMEGDYTLFLIQNTQLGGSGLKLGPGASIDDGEMDLGILQRMSRPSLLKAFGMLQKEGRHVFHPSVIYHRFKHLRIETNEPMAINIDGELIGCTPLDMQVMPQAIRLIV
ncbi:MAG TPA: diacylglycerol kinase family lipid kinase [Candidatus Thalassarchaeaceae archaeon]|nr:MAG TPA: diacylglycerol kinase family lipid kinase [Candidatus Poseidoniales archaeon]HIH85242.1 diacylglycerol kinase family lipid kinase [Candidatus Thalassarchaeaceae archaeon]